jgi:hypothetical protein
MGGVHASSGRGGSRRRTVHVAATRASRARKPPRWCPTSTGRWPRWPVSSVSPSRRSVTGFARSAQDRIDRGEKEGTTPRARPAGGRPTPPKSCRHRRCARPVVADSDRLAPGRHRRCRCSDRRRPRRTPRSEWSGVDGEGPGGAPPGPSSRVMPQADPRNRADRGRDRASRIRGSSADRMSESSTGRRRQLQPLVVPHDEQT